MTQDASNEAIDAVSNWYDCVIVGGGPAGLTAAIYLARFHLAVRVLDAGQSRTRLIPKTRNHAGYPGGIAGIELLNRMAAQAEESGAILTNGRVHDLVKHEDGFLIRCEDMNLHARSVLLATGVTNRRPEMTVDLHDEALGRGLIRYCPICDGFEVTDTRVAVIGTGSHGLREAIFLRSFTADVTLIAPDGPHALEDSDRRSAAEADVVLIDGPADDFSIDDARLSLATGAGRLSFDSIYPALGSIIRSELARPTGAEMSDEGCLLVDAHQRTTCAGLYAAGDVVLGLDQISHAMGEGGVAATTIRNDLAKLRPLLR
ncbi:NAD(P)/FAD-dependent oxidoreductase [Sphingomonas abietis]|uniref:Thioredoxin reductase n=1 Tax=Sphingomonas abietis TaxID=3012344 RepID=A0ABY7NUI0_9SPHN|nr:NAD(P)/FAD-dependent oxidoreductase [Sphingomonas abietis]WBO24450.1 NAD(P)/FAD-dependent oxidoreductase [Sphingomonas abietis]